MQIATEAFELAAATNALLCTGHASVYHKIIKNFSGNRPCYTQTYLQQISFSIYDTTQTYHQHQSVRQCKITTLMLSSLSQSITTQVLDVASE
jgi:hypothetical protein